MEVDAAYEPTVTRKVNGTDVKFSKFTPRDRARLLKDLQAARRAKLEANLKASGIAGEQQFTELEAFDDRGPYGGAEFTAYINTPEGHDDVIARSLRKQGVEDADTVLDGLTMHGGDSLKLVAEICNLTLENAPAETKGEGEENPTETPTAYGK